MTLRLRHLAYGAATFLPLAAAAIDARAQTITVSSISAGGSFGNLVSAPTAITTLTLAASGGTFTTSGGTGVRLTSGADVYTVTIACGPQNACTTTNAKITIKNTGTPANRLGALTNFTVAMGTASQVVAPGTGSTINFTIGPIGKSSSKTFFVGFDTPLLADNSGKATGAGTSAFLVWAAASPTTPSVGLTSTVTANVFRPIAVSNTAGMQFGSIVKPATGSGTVTLTSGGVLTTSAGSILASTSHGAAGFSVSGEGAQAFTLTVPASFVMTTGANSLTVTTSASASGAQTLSSALGSSGSFTATVGGAFPISTSTVNGAYTGNLVVTVAYN